MGLRRSLQMTTLKVPMTQPTNLPLSQLTGHAAGRVTQGDCQWPRGGSGIMGHQQQHDPQLWQQDPRTAGLQHWCVAKCSQVILVSTPGLQDHRHLSAITRCAGPSLPWFQAWDLLGTLAKPSTWATDRPQVKVGVRADEVMPWLIRAHILCAAR